MNYVICLSEQNNNKWSHFTNGKRYEMTSINFKHFECQVLDDDNEVIGLNFTNSDFTFIINSQN